MLKIILLSIILVSSFLSLTASASIINFVSQKNSISGSNTINEAYNFISTDGSAIAHEIQGSADVGFVGSGAGNLNVFAEINGFANLEAFASSVYVFTSDEDILSLNYYGFATTWNQAESAEADIVLKNLTTGSTLINTTFSHSPYDPETLSFNETYTYSPGSDQFELSIIAAARLGENGRHQSSLTSDFSSGSLPAPIPEPSTTILVSAGIICCGFARKLKNRTALTRESSFHL